MVGTRALISEFTTDRCQFGLVQVSLEVLPPLPRCYHRPLSVEYGSTGLNSPFHSWFLYVTIQDDTTGYTILRIREIFRTIQDVRIR
jgi:hypothetical protein